MKRYLMILLLLYIGANAYSQQLLKGSVTTATDKKPLEGASIQVVNTGIKTLTDVRGNFQIRISQENPTLKVSYVGYKTTHIKLSPPFDSPVIISLQQQADTLEEVAINTGYQLIPKERATGSFSTLGNQRLNEQVGMNILDRLPAIANSYAVTSPRINPNGYITIRGFSTMSGPRGPLIVMDNFPYEGDINNINPNDVESIVLLKDAAAASIWGTRAGNGVVVITTKKGAFDRKTKIEFNTNFTTTDKPDLYAYKTISSTDYIDVEQILFANKYRFSDTSSTNRPSFSPVYEILFRQRNGQLSEAEANEEINYLRSRNVKDDFNRYMYQNGVNQQYAINISGGSSNIAWLISAGYDKGVGQVGELDNRLTLRMENTYRVNDKIQFTMGAYYAQNKNRSGKRDYNKLAIGNGVVPPYTELADENGKALPLYNYRQTFIDTAGNGKLLDWKYYPLEDDKYTGNTINSHDLLANAGVRYNVFKGFTADAKFQYERQNTNDQFLQGIQSYATRNLINSFSQIDDKTGTVIYPLPKGDILDLNNTVLQSYNVRGQLSFERTYASHGISSLAGVEIRQNNGDVNNYRTFGLDKDILTTTPVDFANRYPNYLTGGSAFIPNRINFEETVNRYVSIFGNLAYTYKERYVLTASARKDASNIFGVATNDKWRPLWSVGASWNLSDESFYRSALFPYLKIRSTYGLSGNIDPSNVASTTIRYNSSTSPYTSSAYAEVENFYNPQLRWEKVAMFNAGVNFRTIGNRISGSIEYFAKRADDLYGAVPIDMTVGLRLSTLTKNTASMKGKGVDIELNTINLKGEFEWMSHLNFSGYHDKVTRNYTANYRGSNFVNGGMKGLVGKPLYAIYSYRWKGLDSQNGNPLGYINGHISDDYSAITGDSTQLSDLVYNGSIIPTLYGSLGNTLRWKGASLTFRVSYAFGHYFMKESIGYSQLINTGIGHSDYALRWQNPGDERSTDVPSWIYPIDAKRDSYYSNSDVLVAKGDNIRLQYINLSFALPANKIKVIGLASANVFCAASNLGILWRANKDHIDPDYPNTFNLPPRSFSLGLNANF